MDKKKPHDPSSGYFDSHSTGNKARKNFMYLVLFFVVLFLKKFKYIFLH